MIEDNRFFATTPNRHPTISSARHEWYSAKQVCQVFLEKSAVAAW